MKIRLVCQVKRPFAEVVEVFDRQLLTYLLPPLGTLYQYEGQKIGDLVEVRFRIPLMKSWKVIVKEHWETHREYGFTDRGLQVPLGIVYWQHMHRVIARDNHSVFIVDDIEYETHLKIWDYLIYLPLYLGFYLRKPLYRRYFHSILPSKK